VNDREALARAIASTDAIVRDITPAMLAEATPCAEWDVRSLINHVIGQLGSLEGKVRGTKPVHAAAPGALPEGDQVGERPLAAFTDAASGALDSFDSEDALKRAGPTLTAIAADVFVHGWDLARATGRRVEFDDELAEHFLAFVHRGITDENRSPFFGDATDAPEAAPATVRLIAFLGRDPRLARSP
jgi:uncharacterized protein (TIGR03086 family)